MAKRNEEVYKKSAHEDFNSILKGALGNKGRIHITAGKILDENWFAELDRAEYSVNDQLQAIAGAIDSKIYKNYKLWPANYIACDLLNNSDQHAGQYTDKEKRQFERRLTRRVDFKNALEVNSYLLMYANPVINHEALNEDKI